MNLVDWEYAVGFILRPTCGHLGCGVVLLEDARITVSGFDVFFCKETCSGYEHVRRLRTTKPQSRKVFNWKVLIFPLAFMETEDKTKRGKNKKSLKESIKTGTTNFVYKVYGVLGKERKKISTGM